MTPSPCCQPSLELCRRQAVDIARAEATLRAEAAWRDTYTETFARVFDETLAEILAEQRAAEEAA
jgi:hypothetical protein